MKCYKCGSEIDGRIAIGTWDFCPVCHIPMMGFPDNTLDIAVKDLIRDVRFIENCLIALSTRLEEKNG